MLDIEPATRVLAGIIESVRDEQLGAPTPCTETTVGGLIDHVDKLSQAFTGAATKSPLEGSGGPAADATQLGEDWRTRIPQRLSTLAGAWRDPQAWQGMTRAGGIDMPADIAGVVALDEVILHGWDIAVASGQAYDCPPHLLEAAHGFVAGTVARNPQGTPGLFGPPVAVPDDAPLLSRLLGLSGRDPGWQPPG